MGPVLFNRLKYAAIRSAVRTGHIHYLLGIQDGTDYSILDADADHAVLASDVVIHFIGFPSSDVKGLIKAGVLQPL